MIGDDELERALTVRADRQVRADGTLSIGGQDWELEDGFLAGRKLTIARSFVDLQRPPWIEHEGKRLVRRLGTRSSAVRNRPSTVAEMNSDGG